ncbi:uncharacterized protein LOC122847878 [Aphidius gifuensis]|uniref:uncharacterized protein LOC122847878 n=1 Tax=Aphidius gifuensis TaxID=684658 RepID=UPI001CDC6031|nr:uncharacterized protein LOC122847878 [Aphidius gifuensis]
MDSNFKLFSIVICLVVVKSVSSADCDPKECQGPIKYYEAAGCKPIYRQPGDCCAYKYDCDHLKLLSNDKCYVGGVEYNVGDELRKEDALPCNIGCRCTKENDSAARFICAQINCPFLDEEEEEPGPECYRQKKGTSCCPEPKIICPKTPEERPTCNVNGKIYVDGHFFKADGKSCDCGPNYVGENIEPFCAPITKQDPCGLELHRSYEMKNNCPPIFYIDQEPQTYCPVAFRCATPQDVIIKAEESQANVSDLKCSFGNSTLQIGDSLKPSVGDECLVCTCQVPPAVTCKYLPQKICYANKSN